MKLSLILNPHLLQAIIILQGAGCPDANSAPRDERPGNEVSPRNEMSVDKEPNSVKVGQISWLAEGVTPKEDEESDRSQDYNEESDRSLGYNDYYD